MALTEPVEAPATDELELSLFGPGYGECCVVHLGGGEWVIVDSCIDHLSERPAALAYLSDIGIDVAQQVKLVVASHWHDDHIRGLADVVGACPAARFVCSTAFTQEELLTLVRATESRMMMRSSGSDEFNEILDRLIERRKAGQLVGDAPGLANANQLLLQRTAEPPAAVWALSPSSAAVVKALQGFSQLLPEAARPKLRVASPDENDAAVVLWIEVANIRVLLGADLPVTTREDMGWNAVVVSAERPEGQAGLYKIPHHGSENADLPAVWEVLLEKQPHAGLTPYGSGRKPLPSEADCARLCDRTPNIFIAGDQRSNSERRDRAVEKTLKEATISGLRRVEGRMGHVRFRRPLGADEWDVTCVRRARRLCAA